MKGLSKPLSSPGRGGEKFPPPLMRFLRTNAGSRSRGRSRSSPLFYLRGRRSLARAIEPTQEPSSPKVTCMGQVRVRRSGGKSGRRKKNDGGNFSWWDKLKTAPICARVSSGFRKRGRPFRWFFTKWWGLFTGSGYSGKAGGSEDSFGGAYRKNREDDFYRNDGEKCGDGDAGGDSDGGFAAESSSPPPRNALLLTRCRSAPYRSSSLAVRFWGSPFAAENPPGEEQIQQQPTVAIEAPPENNSPEEEEEEVQRVEEIKPGIHPLLLTRCKSEPARTGERLIRPQSDSKHLFNLSRFET